MEVQGLKYLVDSCGGLWRTAEDCDEPCTLELECRHLQLGGEEDRTVATATATCNAEGGRRQTASPSKIDTFVNYKV